MGAIEKAISEVRFAIPYEILNETFKIDTGYSATRTAGIKTSLESRIREEILDKKVLEDCNLMGGHEVIVPLAGLSLRYAQDRTFVVTIPKSRTEGLSITSVLSVAQAPDGWMGSVYTNANAMNSFSNRMDAIMQGSIGGGNMARIEARVRLIGDNVVYVKMIDETMSDLFLRCRVGSDENMSRLPAAYWLDFSKLVILATKAHIFRELAIRMDEGQLSGGLNLGRFKETVDEYADAHQMYNEFIHDSWPRIAALTDEERHSRVIQHQFGRP
tara:strand:- start:70909 stop:71724 length:816 start_codon:yes stop_codon:yes gene_type:complete